MIINPDASDPALLKLAREAWTDARSLEVLVDLLLERTLIKAIPEEASLRRASAYGPSYSARDGAHYLIECSAREWILRQHPELGRLELRITGGWPDILFVVYRNDGVSPDDTLHEVADFQGVRRQPRLLREPTTGDDA